MSSLALACTGVPISWLRLERHALGELGAAERREIDAHLAGCAACRACAAEIGADQVPLPALPRPRAVPARPRWSWLWPTLWPTSGFAAAAALVIVIVVAARPEPAMLAARVSVKGHDVALALVRERDGAIAHDQADFTPGDRWRALFTCAPPLAPYVDLAVIQDGVATFLGASRLPCGNRVPVAPAFRITGAGPATVCLLFDADRAPARTGPFTGNACRVLVPTP